MTVANYTVNGFRRWLCGSCATELQATHGEPLPVPQPCDECVRREQAAPGYVTPTVNYAPTRQESRLPSPLEVARMPGVQPMEPWAQYIERLRREHKQRRAA